LPHLFNSIQKKNIGDKMHEKLTAVFQKSPYGFIGYVEELPGANSQGATLEESKRNLTEAIQLVLEANRQLADEEFFEEGTIKKIFGEVTV